MMYVQNDQDFDFQCYINLKKRLKFQYYLINYFFMIYISIIVKKKIVRYLYEEYCYIILILEYICLDKYIYFCIFFYVVNLKF